MAPKIDPRAVCAALGVPAPDVQACADQVQQVLRGKDSRVMPATIGTSVIRLCSKSKDPSRCVADRIRCEHDRYINNQTALYKPEFLVTWKAQLRKIGFLSAEDMLKARAQAEAEASELRWPFDDGMSCFDSSTFDYCRPSSDW